MGLLLSEGSDRGLYELSVSPSRAPRPLQRADLLYSWSAASEILFPGCLRDYRCGDV